jgi:acyl carrier protein
LPAGVPGELCIGGAGVARGYWNRPELTAQRFVPDPFVKNPDARLYKTGDRVRRRRDGTIEFLGRFDFQVKVQGFRIELGEIESVLTSVPGVREAVCTAHDVGPGDRRLVAYVVADPAERPGEEALRAALRVKLPDFMVPGIYQFLDALPRTPNGKVDRAALPKPERSAARVDKEDVKPSTAWEKRIAAVWQDLLAIDGVNIVDNFFDLGGHSLLAMRAVARIEKETGVKVSPSDLIVQTLGQVAAACEQATAAPAAEPETPQGPAPKRGWIRKLLGG